MTWADTDDVGVMNNCSSKERLQGALQETVDHFTERFQSDNAECQQQMKKFIDTHELKNFVFRLERTKMDDLLVFLTKFYDKILRHLQAVHDRFLGSHKSAS